VNHPASVNTSDQPSSSSANLSPFTSAVPLRPSYTNSVPSLTLKSNRRGGTAKKIKSSLPYKKLLRQLREGKSNRPLNPKPIGLCRMLFLVLQKDGRDGLSGSSSVWHSIRFGHWPSSSFRWQFDVRRDIWRWLFVPHWSFFWKPQWRRLDMMCEMFQIGAHSLCWYGGRFFLWVLSRINRSIVFFIVYILCICTFFYF
jgi:hypothetical protein